MRRMKPLNSNESKFVKQSSIKRDQGRLSVTTISDWFNTIYRITKLDTHCNR